MNIMKRFLYINFLIPDKKRNDAKKLLESVGVQLDVLKSHSFAVKLEKDDNDSASAFLEQVKSELDPDPLVREERIYSRGELEKAELFLITITKYAGDGYNLYGTKFVPDNKCMRCGSGEKQASDLIINTKEMRNADIAITYNFEIIISSRLASIFEENKLTGYSLRPIFHFADKSRPHPGFHQVIINGLLAPLLPQTRIKRSESEFCLSCRKNGLYLDSEMYISRAQVKFSDFLKTQELFGGKRTRGIPMPEYVVSHKVYEILKRKKIKKVEFEPIVLV